MRFRSAGFSVMTAVAVAVTMAPGSASACHKCRHNPCTLVAAPAPASQCVTEMVPQTVYRTRRRTEFRTVTETIMSRVAQTTFIERQRVVCKPVWDTTYIQRTVFVCRPVSRTTFVNQAYSVCRPVSTTRQVTEYCMQPTTQLVTMPVASHRCGHCGKAKPACGCVTVAQTCYTPVPVVRNVVQTQMIAETAYRQVPVTTTQIVRESRVENVPVRQCRIVQELVTDRIPVTTFQCVPKQVTRKIPYPVCETVAETCYRPVTRVVATVQPAYSAPTSYTAPQPMAPAGSGQGAPSKQG